MRLTVPSLVAVPVTVLLAACGSSYGSSQTGSRSASGGPAAASVGTSANATLGETVLVNARGLTLYRLSGEHAGHFICLKGCLQIWHPLTVSASVQPRGSVTGLSAIKRQGMGDQVTYRGMPLYTFAQDRSPGQAKGQGLKDVGTWNAVSAGGRSTPQPPASSTSASPRSSY